MIIITLIYYFMDAKTFYRIIFVGNEPYKNRRKMLNNVKRETHRIGAELQEDDGLNLIMLKDLAESMSHYVRKSISGVFKILIFKISESEFRSLLLCREKNHSFFSFSFNSSNSYNIFGQ